jgi:hypothetical protein
MEIFTVMLTIATFCTSPSYSENTTNHCKYNLIECVAPKEGAKISYAKVSACFKKEAL